ncbi:hypothetical protein RQP54_01920 [Curvibacter sp. APW13]|uniref:O-linked N-acetylglucosamine transferase, SPINDLY family protein n=1 Tax=Curvibacter sp. APW13 TaxID=3077236 RepID=UPI0028DF7C66|nr:hypothetical protein [Curvibacter sp. APW13]MDT8989614.1 hypothetical protein [Curvibacter sp. APW13]
MQEEDIQAAQHYAAALYARGAFDEALGQIESIGPRLGHTGAWHYNRALVLAQLHRFDQALEALAQAAQLGMPAAEVACQEGVIWQMQGALAHAQQAYARALDFAPDHQQSRVNLGAVLLERKDYPAARDVLEAVVDPYCDHAGVLGACWLARRHLAQWDEHTQRHATLVLQGLQCEMPVAEAFTTLALCDEPEVQRTAARLWNSRAQARHAVRPASGVTAGDKLRIGYFSSDFHDHATMHLLAGVLDNHDRARFEVLCFSWGPPTRDAYQLRAMGAADAFIEVHDISDQAVADRARALEIDLAIDLKGATHNGRPGIFAAHAAPVQVNFLGYPGSMGTCWWDYLIADACVIPAGDERLFSERIARLPHCYQPNDAARVLPDAFPSRAAAGLPETAVVLACFNAHYKIGPEVFSAWLEILRAVPHAVLWLLEGHPLARQNFVDAAQAQGIEATRLVFAPWLPQAQHLARLPLADLALDSWPCNAHTTASDALWMGVPLVTWAGRSFASRVAASTVLAVGMPELVCRDATHYVQRVIELSRNEAQRTALRTRLTAARPSAPLFDTRRYIRSLEAAWEAMVMRHRSGLAPAHFAVQESDGGRL